MNGTDRETFVIVGGGFAAASAAATLREEGFAGRVVLFSAEDHLPYERPPLSKGYLTGDATFDDAVVHPAEFYDSHDIELRLGAPVVGIDVARHEVATNQDTLGYDRLLLATGSRARRLPMADESGAPVAYLRVLEDADRIRSAVHEGRRIAIVGGGWIGLEVAASARTAGCGVVVVEPLDQPLLRVLGPEVGALFADLHRSHGVDLRTSTGVRGIRAGSSPDGSGSAVVDLEDGTTVTADLVVVGIGAAPDLDLARAAGLDVDDGVLADEYLRSSHPDVFVAGDIASARHPRLDQRIRVEHWDNAQGQGAAAARNMAGANQPYDRLPFFFSDQYDLGMEYVGHVGRDGYDETIIRPGADAGSYTAFWVKDGRVIAGMHANDWDATAHIRRILDDPDGVDLARLRDPDVPLADVG